MYIHKPNKDNLRELGKRGYKVVVCKDEKEREEVYNTLKQNGCCARAAEIKNKEGKTILFVLTKENNNRKVN